MKKTLGFTLIELMLFIVVSSILLSALLIVFVSSFDKTPNLIQNSNAIKVAQNCMEWYLAKKRISGFNSITCNNPMTLDSICQASSYQITGSCQGDTNYKTMSITVSGNGDASLTLLMSNYA